MATVNLDALIPREDFEIKEESTQSLSSQTIQIRDLERDAFFYGALRKPDFQRETSDWSPERVSDFILSFLSGDLIPSVILWNSGRFLFTIDGAHRLSALIAWVLDDYGDGVVSQSFFQNEIPDEQIRLAEETRKKIKKSIGTYSDHKFAIQNQIKAQPDLLERARRLASLAIQLQWVKGDATKAEESFFKINQQAVPIGPTELRLLRSRKKASALAARAIIRSGTGHKYWSGFSGDIQEQIEVIAREINNVIFTPELRNPIKTLDLPLAGQEYSHQTLTLILDLVNLVNEIKSEEKSNDDKIGEETIRVLKNTRRIVYRLSGTHPSSLGLHPAIYFYSPQGRFQSTSFLAMVQLIKDFEDKNYFNKFIERREKFEDFILKYRDFVQQINYKYGSGIKGYGPLHELYQFILDNLEDGMNEEEIIRLIKNESRYSFIKTDKIFTLETRHKDFSRENKSEAFLREALKNPLRCNICKGLIHMNSITIDHIIRKEDGGFGIVDNAQLAHPYCNTTFKN
jgi:hypothetical protein